MRILDIQPEPLERFTYWTVSSGDGIIEAQLPVYAGHIAGLPDSTDALIVTSDLQGMMSIGQS
ncbi:hypothetical protein [Paenibacillus sp. y28]|uniref:hypothetical protein n=1 Tax=Paenibacillus sp. y28 TaxID=3129110 RepID=UPI00301A495F